MNRDGDLDQYLLFTSKARNHSHVNPFSFGVGDGPSDIDMPNQETKP